MHDLILLCAGLSTRFKNYRPKWSITHPSGHMMSAESIRGLSCYDSITVLMRNEHVIKFGLKNVEDEFRIAGFDVKVINVGDTNSPIETMKNSLKQVKIDGSFTAKDCDNYFKLDLDDSTSAAVCDMTLDVEPKGKKFAISKDDNLVSSSDVETGTFYCGAYTFSDIDTFIENSNDCKNFYEVYDNLISKGHDIKIKKVKNYVDWGTEEEWGKFLSKFKVLFVDVDGVLVKSSHRTFEKKWGTTEIIQENVDIINDLCSSGNVQVILVTSRDESARHVTEQQLKNVKYSRLMMGIQYGHRIIINDYVESRGKTCSSINILRNSKDLKKELSLISMT